MEKNQVDKSEVWSKYILGLGLVVLGGGILLQAFGYKSEYIAVYEGALFIAGGLYLAFHKKTK